MGSSNSFSYVIPTIFGNTIQANVVITDNSGIPTTANSVWIKTLTINNAPAANVLLESNTKIDNGQSSTLTAGATGGTVPYSFNWFSQASCAGSSFASGVTTSVSPSSTTTYSFNVVDSATINDVVCSSSNSVTVYSTPTVSITPTNTVINAGQYAGFTTSVSGGSGTFGTYNFIVFNVVSSSLMANQLGAGTTFFVATNSLWVSNSAVQGNVIVTDTGVTTPFNFNSPNTANIVINPTPSISALPGTQTYDIGQSITQTATIVPGSPNYVFNQLIWSGSSVVYNSLSPKISSTTNVIVLTAASLGAGTYTYNVFGTDSATTPETFNTVPYTLIINTALSAAAPTPPAPTIDNGQSITLTGLGSGGTASYTYQWYTGGACNSAIGGATGSSVIVSPASTTTYSYAVTDSASTPVTVCSSGDTVTVSPALKDTWIASQSTLNIGQIQTLTANLISVGTPTYTFNILVYNAIDSLVYNSLETGTFQTLNAVSYNQISAWGTGTFIANVIITDSAYSPITLTNSLTYTVNSGYIAPTVTISSPSNAIADVNQYETFTATAYNGVTQYTYNILAVNAVSVGTITHNSLTTISGLSQGFTFQLISADTANSPQKGNVILTNGHPTTVNSVYSSNFVVYATPVANQLTPSNVVLTSGQSTTYNVLISFGSGGPFTANLVSSGGTVINTITGAGDGIVTFGSFIPVCGAQTYNVIATDFGTSTPYIFSSSSNTIQGAACSSGAVILLSQSQPNPNETSQYAAFGVVGIGISIAIALIFNNKRKQKLKRRVNG